MGNCWLLLAIVFILYSKSTHLLCTAVFMNFLKINMANVKNKKQPPWSFYWRQIPSWPQHHVPICNGHQKDFQAIWHCNDGIHQKLHDSWDTIRHNPKDAAPAPDNVEETENYKKKIRKVSGVQCSWQTLLTTCKETAAVVSQQIVLCWRQENIWSQSCGWQTKRSAQATTTPHISTYALSCITAPASKLSTNNNIKWNSWSTIIYLRRLRKNIKLHPVPLTWTRKSAWNSGTSQKWQTGNRIWTLLSLLKVSTSKFLALGTKRND